MRDYRSATGRSQKALAQAVGLHPTVLSNKLNGTDNAKLNRLEIKQLILTLAEWQGVTTCAEVTELLAFLELNPSLFTPEEWQSSPLNQLENKVTPVTDKPLTASAIAEPEIAHNNIPALLTSFIGRERERAEIAELMRDNITRLLTITGPAGIGKTRLALQVANTLLPDFQQGVHFVSLASLTDPNLLTATLLQSFSLKEIKGELHLVTLQNFLRDKNLLLILDNFEQIVQTADLLPELLTAAPQLKLLVTSREVLRLYGEWEFKLSSLSLPDKDCATESLAQCEAVQLFAQRARAVKPDFKLSVDNVRFVADICLYLDGLPLAIELAAARLRTFSVASLLTNLQATFGSRLQLLTGQLRDRPDRQQTLRQAIAWSYNLLTTDEQQLFRHLSVLVSSYSVEAVASVCFDSKVTDYVVIEKLDSLVSKSLLQQLEGDTDAPRFTMLETLREYAYEQLRDNSEFAILQERQASYFLQLAEQAAPQLMGSEQTKWLQRLDSNHSNLRAALNWSIETKNYDFSLRLAAALWRFWWMRGYLSEGRRWFDTILQKIEAPNQSQETFSHDFLVRKADGYNFAGNFAHLQGDYDKALYLHHKSLKLQQELDNKAGIGAALNSLALVANYQAKYDEAAAYFEQNLAIQRELKDCRAESVCLGNLGVVKQYQGDYAEAVKLLEVSLHIKQELNDKQTIAVALNNLGLALLYQSEYERAGLLFEESLKICSEIGHKRNISYALNNLGLVALHLQNYQKAADFFQQSLQLKQEMNDKESIAWTLEGLAGVAGGQSQPELAARLYGAAEASRQKLGTPLPLPLQTFHFSLIAKAKAQLSAGAWEQAWNEGRSQSLDQVFDIARQVIALPAPATSAISATTPALPNRV